MKRGGSTSENSFFSQLAAYVGFDIFISYKASEGAAYAKSLHARLSKKYRVFLDSKQIYAGDSLPQTIKRKLRRSSVLVVVAGPASSSSAWINKEIEYYTTSKKHLKIIPILFEGAILDKTDAFKKLQDFKGVKEAISNLSTGNISEGVLAEIKQAVGRLTKSRLNFLIIGAITIIIALSFFLSYKANQSTHFGYWLQQGKNYLDQSQPDFARLAFTRASRYSWGDENKLMKLYNTATDRSILKAICVIKHRSDETPEYIADLNGNPALVFSDFNDSLLYISYRGKKLPVAAAKGSVESISSDSSSVLIRTGQGIYTLTIKDSLLIEKVPVKDATKVNNAVKFDGKIFTSLIRGGDVAVTIYSGKSPFNILRSIHLQGTRSIDKFILHTETGSFAGISVNPESSETYLYRWDAPFYCLKVDTLSLAPSTTLLNFEGADDNKRFLLYFLQQPDWSTPGSEMAEISEPDDPFRKAIPLPGPLRYFRLLNDSKNYAAYLSDGKELKIIPYFSYVVTAAQPVTVTMDVQNYKLLQNIRNFNKDLILAVKDSGLCIYEGRYLAALYTFRKTRIKSIIVSPSSRFIAVESDTATYIWNQTNRVHVTKLPSFESLSNELRLQLAINQYNNFRVP